MKSESESLIPRGARNAGAAEGNCDVARRGGEQPEAELWSQTQVNTIRPSEAASLLAIGEAYLEKNADLTDRSSKEESVVSEGGWCGNVVKVSYGSRESCADQNCEEQGTAVRAVVGATKAGNAAGAKDSRKMEASNKGSSEGTPSAVPATDKQGGADLWESCKAKRGVWSEKMLEALINGVKGNKWFSLMDKVYHRRTLELAWAKVLSNAGACGVDGITVARFEKTAESGLLALGEQLKDQSYQPKPVKRVWIPKAGSKELRPLGIPTVKDRIVQAAVRLVIEPIYEHKFNEHSYGFRPGRGCKDALRRVDGLLKGGYTHVVDVDIKGYFDAIPHGKLMEKVSQHISDGRVLNLIESFLKAGVMEELSVSHDETGTPQGGIISPLLANLYLNDLDWKMQREGFELTRYADDMVVMCRSAQEAQEALVMIREWMEGASLTLHPEKTRIVDMSVCKASFDFLGYRFYRTLKGKISRLVRPKSEKKLRDKLKSLTKRANGFGIEQIINKVNPILRGWFGYFKQAATNYLSEIDRWLRQRLRAILRKRRGLRGKARGKDMNRWNNHYLSNLGLFSLKTAKEAYSQSLR